MPILSNDDLGITNKISDFLWALTYLCSLSLRLLSLAQNFTCVLTAAVILFWCYLLNAADNVINVLLLPHLLRCLRYNVFFLRANSLHCWQSYLEKPAHTHTHTPAILSTQQQRRWRRRRWWWCYVNVLNISHALISVFAFYAYTTLVVSRCVVFCFLSFFTVRRRVHHLLRVVVGCFVGIVNTNPNTKNDKPDAREYQILVLIQH